MNNEFNNQNMISNLENNNNFNCNNNDKWKDTLILILAIIVFILTVVSLYLVIDRKDNDTNNDNQNNQQEKENNNGDKKDNKIEFNNIECEESENSCTKIFNMNYNDIEHEIKIIQTLESEGNGVPYSYLKKIKIYIDDELVDIIENISSGTNATDFDGYAYIFDSKYLGILYPSHRDDYVLNIYNNDTKIGEQKIIWGLQSFYKDSEHKEELNTLDKIEFDGNKLLFWGDPCYIPINAGDKFVRVSLTIKNNKIDMEAVEYLDKTYGSGATC